MFTNSRQFTLRCLVKFPLQTCPRVTQGQSWLGNLVRLGLGTCLGLAVLGNGQQVEAADKAFLWTIQSAENPTNTVYLLGSVHFLKAEHYPLPAAMQTAFEDAERVVFEINLDSSSSQEARLMLLDKAQPEPGETFETSLSPTTYALASQHVAEAGLPIEAFHNFEPWFFTLSFLPLKLRQLGFEAQYGVDRFFFNAAVTAQKPILTLETFESQLDLFETLSITEQDAFLRQSLQELDALEDAFGTLVEAWQTGDIQTFENLMLASFRDYPKLEQIFLTNRNQLWLENIRQFLQEDQDYLIVVGAAHLVGKRGLVELLERQGYRVEQQG